MNKREPINSRINNILKKRGLGFSQRGVIPPAF
jgi:hypothetical protein